LIYVRSPGVGEFDDVEADEQVSDADAGWETPA
jgi:hypothetical protein